MMQSQEDTFTMPLTLKAHHVANQFRQQQPDAPKAKQVYLNSLAVQAVQSYLNWFGVETDLQHSDCWHPALQALADTADLVVVGKGKLECRPVLPGEQICRVPPEVWSERIGYVAVQFNPELSEATLLGFVPSVTTAEVPLSQLRSLEELLDVVYSPPPKVVVAPVRLSQWLQGMVETGWQTIEDLFGLQQPVWSFRSGELLQSGQANPMPITRGKILELGRADTAAIALLIGLMPADNNTVEVWVKICPTGDQTHLPPELELMVLDAAGIAVMQAQSRSTEMIQLKFSGLSGEQFSIKVSLGSHSLTEDFVI